MQVYDPAAARRAVNLNLNSDMVSRARAADLNLSAIAEEAIGRALRDMLNERLRDEIAHGVADYEDYLMEYGNLADAIRAMEQEDAK